MLTNSELKYVREKGYSHNLIDCLNRLADDYFKLYGDYIIKYNKFNLGDLIRRNRDIASRFNSFVSHCKDITHHYNVWARYNPDKENVDVEIISGCYLGRVYPFFFTKKEYKLSIKYLKRGAKAGIADAQVDYGNYLLKKKKFFWAKLWFKRALKDCPDRAANGLANCLEDEYYEYPNSKYTMSPDVLNYFWQAVNCDCHNSYGDLYRPIFICHLARYYCIRKRDYNYALELINMVDVDIYPFVNQALGNVYMSRGQSGDYLKAYHCFKKHINYSYRVYDLIALLYRKNKIINELENADTWVEKAIEKRKMCKQLLIEQGQRPDDDSCPEELYSIYDKHSYSFSWDTSTGWMILIGVGSLLVTYLMLKFYAFLIGSFFDWLFH